MTVEDAKCVQANAFIQASMFRQYTYQGDAPISFQINLAALIVSLHASVPTSNSALVRMLHSQLISESSGM